MTLFSSCDSENDRISELDSLRIIAVRSDKPFARPSSTVALEMLVDDASPKAITASGTKRTPQLLWLGGCVNPDGDLYYNCFSQLRAALQRVSDEELNTGVVTANTERAALGFGANYQLNVPRDVISGRPQASGVTYPYGVIVVFYAACAGELRVERVARSQTEYPIGCYDANTNKALGQGDFEFGFYPIYAYETLENQLPLVKSAAFGATASGQACTSQDDCGSHEACGSSGVCIPRVSACQKGKTCKKYKYELLVDEASAEPAASAYVSETAAPLETLWVSYYADFGSFQKDSRIIHDAASGYTNDYGGVWSASVDDNSPSTPREANLYAVVRDNRGGVTWVTQTLYVE
jgi:hypothetical protein